MTRYLAWIVYSIGILSISLPANVMARTSADDAVLFSFGKCRREVLHLTKDGFLVQDFYLNGRKITDPYLVTEVKDIILGDCSRHVERQKNFYAKYSQITPSIQGRLVEWYQTGEKWKEVEFIGQNKGRQEIYYDPNGTIKLSITYVDRNNSIGVFLDEKGRRTSEGPYLNGIGQGEWTYYYPESDRIMMKRTYQDGRIIGPFTIYWQNGNKQQEGTYLRGEKSGEVLYWSEDGLKMAQVTYVKGVREGKYRAWYRNGQVRSEGYYHAGQRFGSWVFWYKNGQRQAEGNFEPNEVSSKYWYVWNQQGRLLTHVLKDGSPIFMNFPKSLDIARAGRLVDPYIDKDVEYRLNYAGLVMKRDPTPLEEEKRKLLEEFLKNRPL